MVIENLLLDEVQPSPMNPRKTVDESALLELADNIGQQGLLQPITVRKQSQFYEIVCGERRYRAMCILNARDPDKFSTIPAIVKEMSDAEAFDAMITENLQRKDVDPMEEAFAFGQLIKNGATYEEIAVRFGKSIRFVQDRCKLNQLIPDLAVAVKDGKCPIVVASIICKLKEDEQLLYYKNNSNSYTGMTKRTAEDYVDRLFMSIENSLWYSSDAQEDENFDGGCGCKCAECALNTANAKCLFWEMKSEDAGSCTDRKKFEAKTLAYIEQELDKLGDSLVKEDEPLIFGKTVLTVDNSYLSDEQLEKLSKVESIAKSKGLMIVNADKTFLNRIWYDNDDERIAEALESGEAYRVLNIFDRYPSLTLRYYRIRKDDQSCNCGENGMPLKVRELLGKLEKKESERSANFLTKGCETIRSCAKITNAELLPIEKNIIFATLLKGVLSRLKFDEFKFKSTLIYAKDAREYLEKNPDDLTKILRGWLLGQLGSYECMEVVKPFLDELGTIWCPEEYQAVKDEENGKFEKAKARIEKDLNKLGYDINGKPLSE